MEAPFHLFLSFSFFVSSPFPSLSPPLQSFSPPPLKTQALGVAEAEEDAGPYGW